MRAERQSDVRGDLQTGRGRHRTVAEACASTTEAHKRRVPSDIRSPPKKDVRQPLRALVRNAAPQTQARPRVYEPLVSLCVCWSSPISLYGSVGDARGTREEPNRLGQSVAKTPHASPPLSTLRRH